MPDARKATKANAETAFGDDPIARPETLGQIEEFQQMFRKGITSNPWYRSIRLDIKTIPEQPAKTASPR